MSTATYTLWVDWDGDGDFLDAGEDISDDLISGVVERGFSSPTARMGQTGRATFVLWNGTRAYSPAYTAAALPRRAVRLDMTVGLTTATIFAGFVKGLKPEPGQWRARTAMLECVDALDLLGLHEGSIAALQNALANEIIAAIVASVYTPPSTDYQTGINVFPVSADNWDSPSGIGFEDTPAGQKIERVCGADWGRFWIAGSGAPTYRNRHSHIGAASVLTLETDGSLRALGYDKGDASIYNHVEIGCYPRAVGTIYERLGYIGGDSGTRNAPPAIEPGATRTFELQYKDPAGGARMGALAALTPVSDTDYAATSDEAGEGADVTADISVAVTAYGDRAMVAVSNGGAALAYLQRLQVRGLAVRVRAQVTVQAQDATSILAYQRRKLRVSLPTLSSEAEGQALADYLLRIHKEPRDVVGGISFDGAENDTLMAAARDLELLDKITVTEYQTGLSSYAGFVYRLRHAFGDGRHIVTFDLDSLTTPAGNIFTLYTSTTGAKNILTDIGTSPVMIY